MYTTLKSPLGDLGVRKYILCVFREYILYALEKYILVIFEEYIPDWMKKVCFFQEK